MGVGRIRAGRIDRLLAVDFQAANAYGGPQLVVWFEGEPGDQATVDTVAVLTGMAPPDDVVYVGTAQTLTADGPFVVHVYERPR